MSESCGVCKEECKNQYVVIKDTRYHSKCFKCVECETPLAGKPFLQDEGQFYCDTCYYTKQGIVCGHCEEIIKGEYIEAMDKKWHEDHFVCSTCTEPFNTDQFWKHEGRPYCQKDYQELVCEDCVRCGKKIDGKMIIGAEKKYHPDCFRCQEGHEIKEGEVFHEYGEKLYCDEHLRREMVKTCPTCNKVIDGEYVKIGSDYFHRECADSGGGDDSGDDGGSGGGGVSSKAPAPEEKKEEAPKKTVKKKKKKQEEEKKEPVKEAPKEEEYATYTYEFLRDKQKCIDNGLIMSKRECYLDDDEFQKLMGLSKERFKTLPKWKRKAKKTKLKIF